jgi:hypothetical protein
MLQEISDLDEKICEEIKEWSKHALEIPNKNYNNLPSCPYAKKAWHDNKVAFSFKRDTDYSMLHAIIDNFKDNKDLVILIDLDYEDNESFHNYLNLINQMINQNMFTTKDMWVMGFHPDDDVNELIDDGSFEEVVNEEYSLIFIQRLSKLQESANKLKKLGYYDKYYNEYNVKDIYEQRENFYRSLKWQ